MKSSTQEAHERVLQYGTTESSNADLLSSVLCTSREVGYQLLVRFSSLRDLEKAGIAELCGVPGIGEKRAAALKSALALGRRLTEVPLKRGQSYTSSRDVFQAYGPKLHGLEHEEFWCLLLDQRNRVLREVRVSQGSINKCPVMPQDIFAPAMREKAVGLVFLHQHPSGDPEPSSDDRSLTMRLCHIAELLNIKVVDHIVVGDGCYVSFADRNWL